MERVAEATYFLASVEPVPPDPWTAEEGRGSEVPAKADAPDGGAAEAPGPNGKAVPSDASADQRPRDAAAGSSYTAPELLQLWAPSVVTIRATRPRGPGGGSGFVIDDQGTVATSFHVIRDATEVRIELADGTGIGEVVLLAEDEERDVALLRIPGDQAPKPVILGDSETVAVGDPAVSIGNPLGLDCTLNVGSVSARREYRGQAWIEVSAPASPGNSGGPLFNMGGQVVGITARAVAWSPAQNLNLAIPINELKKMIKPTYPNRRAFGDDDAQAR
jgi:S1-C subfamily serine protease